MCLEAGESHCRTSTWGKVGLDSSVSGWSTLNLKSNDHGPIKSDVVKA